MKIKVEPFSEELAPAVAERRSTGRRGEPDNTMTKDLSLPSSVSIQALSDIPRVQEADDLSGHLIAALEWICFDPRPNDILVVTQKVVSKAEGRVVNLATLTPGEKAIRLAERTGKDPAMIAAVLDESRNVVRSKAGCIITETRHGLIMANAGIDQSNLEADDGEQLVLLLPVDPDASAAGLKERLDAHFNANIGVIVSDSAGRAWRLGVVGLAIGAAGVPSIIDRRGEPDMCGRPLEVTEIGFADAVAAAAVLVMGEGAEGTPAALVRGLSWTAPDRPARALVRPQGEDMFR